MIMHRRWAVTDHFPRIPFTHFASSVIRLAFEKRSSQAPIFDEALFQGGVKSGL
jgi:hypothetical protein